MTAPDPIALADSIAKNLWHIQRDGGGKFPPCTAGIIQVDADQRDLIVTALRALAASGEDESKYDNAMFNVGVQHVVDLLAKTIEAEGWVAGDGSEDYDDDLTQTLLNILAARGLYDKEEGEFAAPAAPIEAKPVACRTCSGDGYINRHANLPDEKCPDCQESSAPEGPADEIIGEIEKRFPNWKSFRDLIDCIDCTLHDLRHSGFNAYVATPPASPSADLRGALEGPSSQPQKQNEST